MRKKALNLAAKRVAVHSVVAERLCSQRQACRWLKLARSTCRYQGRLPSLKEQPLQRRVAELSLQYPRYGYRRITALLRREGWSVGKRLRQGVSTGLPTQATHRNHVWTWDFIADTTVRGGTLRMLTILDEHTRECHVLRVERALRSQDVLHWLQQAIGTHGAPEYLRSDNGSEFITRSRPSISNPVVRGRTVLWRAFTGGSGTSV